MRIFHSLRIYIDNQDMDGYVDRHIHIGTAFPLEKTDTNVGNSSILDSKRINQQHVPH